MEAKGVSRRIILEITERLTYKFATKILCNSYGLSRLSLREPILDIRCGGFSKWFNLWGTI